MKQTTADHLSNILNQIDVSLMEGKLQDIPELTRLARESIALSAPNQGDQMTGESWIVAVLMRDDVDVDTQVSSQYTDEDMEYLAQKMIDNDAFMDQYWESLEYAKEQLGVYNASLTS